MKNTFIFSLTWRCITHSFIYTHFSFDWYLRLPLCARIHACLLQMSESICWLIESEEFIQWKLHALSSIISNLAIVHANLDPYYYVYLTIPKLEELCELSRYLVQRMCIRRLHVRFTFNHSLKSLSHVFTLFAFASLVN